MAPCPPLVSTQPPTSTPQQNPIFSESIITTTTAGLTVDVNTSDAGEKTSGFTTTTTTPVSPQHHGSEDFLGVVGFDFDTFHYSPFSIQEESDDDAPITQKDLKALNVKLDSILASSTTSSSQAYSEAAVKGMLNTLVKEHVANLPKYNKAVEDSTRSC